MQPLQDLVDTDLDVKAEMSTFYVRDMLAHLGSPLAKARLEAQAKRLAPKLAAYLFAIVGGELRYANNGDGEGGLSCGCHCEECHWSDTEVIYEHKTCEHGDTERDRHGHKDADACYKCGGTNDRRDWSDYHERGPCGYRHAGEMMEPEYDNLPWMSDDMRDFLEIYNSARGNDRNDAWAGWWRWQANGGDPVKMLDEAARIFEQADWSYGFGGKAWATIAKLARDYYAGKLKDVVFVDRVWSIEHNGGCCFDKMYDTYGMMDLLVSQAANDYTPLLAKVDGETRAMWSERQHRATRMFDNGFTIPEYHAERDDVWLGVQRDTNERVW